jgi:hypothetical protein
MAVKIHFRRMENEDFWRLLLPFIFSFVIGVLLKLWNPCYSWLYGIASPLADAFMVAGIIGVGLELVATKFLIESAADDLAGKLVGRGLPRELQRHIIDIVNTKIVRDHYVKSYRFSEPNDEHRVKVELEIRFDVRNWSELPVSYTPTMDEEDVFKPEFLYLEYQIKGKPPKSFSAQQLEARIKNKYEPSTTTKEVSGDEIQLEPFRDNPESICNVTWRLRVTLPDEFSDVSEFHDATIGATLRLAERPDWLQFESSGDMQPRNEESLSWVFNGPFIAGQQIRARWFRKPGTRRNH